MTWKHKATPASRGYGYAHRKQRAEALAMLIDGTPCPLCRLPMLKGKQSLELDHVVPLALTGRDSGNGPVRLVHARCNQRRGARLGAGRSPHKARYARRPRRW
jgi:5-methylcytosine-specific restriction endonuclease McrA